MSAADSGEFLADGCFRIPGGSDLMVFSGECGMLFGAAQGGMGLDAFCASLSFADGARFLRSVETLRKGIGNETASLRLRRRDAERRFFIRLARSGGDIAGFFYFDPPEAGSMDLDALLEMSRLLQSDRGLHGFLQLIAAGVREAVHADRTTLITFDEGAIEHFLKAGPGMDRIVDVDYAELWDGLSGWVLRERKTAISPRGTDDDRESPEVRARRRETECGDIIVAPLIHSNKVLGTITAINHPDDEPFTGKDAEIVESLARMSAVAIIGAKSFFKRKNQVEELYRLATHDELTKLFNRRMFSEVAVHAIANAKRRGQSLAFMYLDLDGFKAVNDGHGHYCGDCVLKEAAVRIGASVRESETAARLGGDEFGILFENAADRSGVESVARRLIENLGRPYLIEDAEIRIGASAGIAFFPADAQDYEALLALADSALYLAKGAGRNAYRIYDPAGSRTSEQEDGDHDHAGETGQRRD